MSEKICHTRHLQMEKWVMQSSAEITWSFAKKLDIVAAKFFEWKSQSSCVFGFSDIVFPGPSYSYLYGLVDDAWRVPRLGTLLIIQPKTTISLEICIMTPFFCCLAMDTPTKPCSPDQLHRWVGVKQLSILVAKAVNRWRLTACPVNCADGKYSFIWHLLRNLLLLY